MKRKEIFLTLKPVICETEGNIFNTQTSDLWNGREFSQRWVLTALIFETQGNILDTEIWVICETPGNILNAGSGNLKEMWTDF